jgi:hypothetical protein
MKQTNRMIVIIIRFILVILIPVTFAFADHDDHKGRKDSHEKHYDHDDDKRDERNYLSPVNNETFKLECGACHSPYQPGLLPAGSWEKILTNLPSHFGEEVSLSRESRTVIGAYLRDNAAEKSYAKRARKILKSLNGQTPLRITKTPYIQEKHHELSSKIISRPSIGSLSNCSACHSTAEQGNYDDDFVEIPK